MEECQPGLNTHPQRGGPRGDAGHVPQHAGACPPHCHGAASGGRTGPGCPGCTDSSWCWGGPCGCALGGRKPWSRSIPAGLKSCLSAPSEQPAQQHTGPHCTHTPTPSSGLWDPLFLHFLNPYLLGDHYMLGAVLGETTNWGKEARHTAVTASNHNTRALLELKSGPKPMGQYAEVSE